MTGYGIKPPPKKQMQVLELERVWIWSKLAYIHILNSNTQQQITILNIFDVRCGLGHIVDPCSEDLNKLAINTHTKFNSEHEQMILNIKKISNCKCEGKKMQ